MKLLATIREKDVDPGLEQLPDEAHGKFRQAAKVVLFDEDGRIALNYYAPNPEFPAHEYYIPGGGVDEGETILEALHREALEETGCKIKDIKEVGYVIFYMKDRNLKQEAHIYMAKLDGEKGEPQFTEKEKEHDLQVVWKPLDEAIDLVSKSSVKNHSRLNAIIILGEVKEILDENIH